MRVSIVNLQHAEPWMIELWYYDIITHKQVKREGMKVNKENIIIFLNDIKSELESDGISKIGLFGSFSRDSESIYSDIDIAIQKEKGYLVHRTAYDYFDEVSKIKTIIKKKFHRNIDVFDVDSNSSMLETIKKDLIYV